MKEEKEQQDFMPKPGMKVMYQRKSAYSSDMMTRFIGVVGEVIAVRQLHDLTVVDVLFPTMRRPLQCLLSNLDHVEG